MFVQLTALKANPAAVYLFKVHNRNIKILCETCLKLKRTSSMLFYSLFVVNFEHI